MNIGVYIGFWILLLAVVLAFGLPPLWIATRGRHTAGPRFLGVCWRLPRKRQVAVGPVRVLEDFAG